jgi:hypothetical protein
MRARVQTSARIRKPITLSRVDTRTLGVEVKVYRLNCRVDRGKIGLTFIDTKIKIENHEKNREEKRK